VVQQGSDMSAGYDLNVQAGRNILIGSAAEQSAYQRETSQTRTGTTTTVNHNFGNMVDGLNGAGKGDNTVSQASRMGVIGDRPRLSYPVNRGLSPIVPLGKSMVVLGVRINLHLRFPKRN
jgi:hypothetical protein